jgi:hypothetical protein
MSERIAWPYRCFEGLSYSLKEAYFKGPGSPRQPLDFREAPGEWVIAGRILRDYPKAEIGLVIETTTGNDAVTSTVLGDGEEHGLDFGYRILCHNTKHRCFVRSKAPGVSEVKMALDAIGGVVQITPLFVATGPARTKDGDKLWTGAIVAPAVKPVLLKIDRDWSGDRIPFVWVDFKLKQLPEGALVHVQLVGDMPEVWLNEKFQKELGVLTTKGNNIAGIAGAALRDVLQVMIWEKILIWALENEGDNWKNPATRIADKWRKELAHEDLKVPRFEDLDSDEMNGVSLAVQHCIQTGRNLSRVQQLFEFKIKRTGES